MENLLKYSSEWPFFSENQLPGWIFNGDHGSKSSAPWKIIAMCCKYFSFNFCQVENQYVHNKNKDKHQMYYSKLLISF